MITVDAVYKALEKMKRVYPFKDDDTAFHMENNPARIDQSVVCIATLDSETGVKVRLEKDASEEMQHKK